LESGGFWKECYSESLARIGLQGKGVTGLRFNGLF
jgi:hypothetical protein